MVINHFCNDDEEKRIEKYNELLAKYITLINEKQIYEV